MSGRARYAAILRAPHVAPLLLASMLARLPYGLYALAAILYLARRATPTRSPAWSTARSAIGAAVGVPCRAG